MSSLNWAKRIGEQLKKKKATLGLAESCTGGLIGDTITNVAGASDYLVGGLISYSNQVKKNQLKVPATLLAKEGAVSQKTALAMAKGAKKLFQSRYALATTGIAGPSGGRPKKPVGLVFITLTDGKRSQCHKKIFKGGRLSIKKQTAEAALKLLSKFIG